MRVWDFEAVGASGISQPVLYATGTRSGHRPSIATMFQNALATRVGASRYAAQVRAVTVASWRTVPNTLIGCANSQTRSEARARFASRAMHAIEIPGDHFALWQRPGELAEIITRIAQDATAQ